MKIEADLHVHTIASGHAFSTVLEIAREAAVRNIRGVGISDHGPAIAGAPNIYYFRALAFLPPEIEGVRIFKGAEANIVNHEGELDIPDWVLERLDYAMVGFHAESGIESAGLVKNTDTVLKAMARPKVRVVTHPGNPAFPIDHAEFVKAAAEFGVAVEINNHSFGLHRKGSLENCASIALETARQGWKVLLSSDAHLYSQVGMVGKAWEVARDSGITEDQVINRTLEGTLEFLKLG